MFKHEGPARSFRLNVILASFLAFIAGYVNSGGFVVLGRFTSHVTGSIGHFADAVARGEARGAIIAVVLIAGFFLGAFAATAVLERKHAVVSRKYGAALALEALLLAAFIVVSDPELASFLLSVAMGVQNSLVTRLSGSVVRTTHMTGLVTDFGIEFYRWLHYWIVGREKPIYDRGFLLATIILAFVIGATAGALLTYRVSSWAMVFPAAAVCAASVYAIAVESR